MSVGQKELLTQSRVVKLFQEQLGYHYLGNWEDRLDNKNIEEELIRDYLIKNNYSSNLINKAIHELNQKSSNQVKDLYYVNQDVYTDLRYGITIKEELGQNAQTVHFIDWKDPENNQFYIAEEVTVKGTNKKRPDIVIYINGIAIGILELKRSTISVSEGIRQNLDNQNKIFIRHFFSTIQLIMAGNDTQGIRYGTIETPEKYYLTWKEDSDVTNLLDRHLIQLCNKKRLLELLHDFIVFDGGTKKLCRQNQYFGVKAAQDRIHKREGGIIWHAQGSGKSLTMVWLTKWIRENVQDARVLIITDRDELDEQIERVFKGVDEDIYRTKSGADLIEKLNLATPWLLCSLIHKFGNKEEKEYDSYIDELTRTLPKDFLAKGDIFVFVDECHRTQSGKLHQAMKKILPSAMFIGFTGTPLLKEDKKKSLEIFGPYIHTYKFDEAVRDGVVLDLCYEARNIDQDISSEDKIDKWFETKTKGLTDYAKYRLKQKWVNMRRVLSSRERLEKIVTDIIFDMETKDRLQNGSGNAMLVAGSIHEACKFYELFQQKGLRKCAIITSYNPSIDNIKGESTGESIPTYNQEKYQIYQKMLNGKDIETFETEAKKQFIKEPAKMKLLIVVDKLLTGFDAPPATYLYIDKSMQDHGLFQAICRVNRLDGEDKRFGYIIDYKDLFQSLEKSITDYTSGAFEKIDTEDTKGLLNDRLKKGKEQLDIALESVKYLCEPVKPPRNTQDYIYFFCGDSNNPNDLNETQPRRLKLYKLVSALIRSFSEIANEMEQAGYTPKQIIEIKEYVKHYTEVKDEIKIASGDYIDLKTYEPAMRHLIDTYISADESEKISAFDDIPLVDLIINKGTEFIHDLPTGIGKNKNAIAETTENNIRRLIVEKAPTNPKYYEKMSTLLDELIRLRKSEVEEYTEYLKKIVELAKDVKNPGDSVYPKSVNTKARKALYDNLDRNESLAIAIDLEITNTRQDDWRGNNMKIKRVKNAIKKHISDDDLVDTIFELVKNQSEY